MEDPSEDRLDQCGGTTYLNFNHIWCMGLTNYVKKCNNSVCAAHQYYMLVHNLGGSFRLQ